MSALIKKRHVAVARRHRQVRRDSVRVHFAAGGVADPDDDRDVVQWCVEPRLPAEQLQPAMVQSRLADLCVSPDASDVLSLGQAMSDQPASGVPDDDLCHADRGAGRLRADAL
jgi:hypothetical protein